jgi:hypothetical protein
LRHELRTTKIIIDIVVAEAGTAPAPPAFSAFRFERYAIKSGITSPGASRDRTEAVQAWRADAAHPSRMSAASLICRKPVVRSPASAPSASSAPVSRTLGAGVARIVARQALMSPTPLTILHRAFSRAALILIILFPARPSRLKVISMPSARKKVCARRSRPASARGFLGQSALLREAGPPPARSAAARRRSDAVPVHVLRLMPAGSSPCSSAPFS